MRHDREAEPKARVFASCEERDQWQRVTYGHIRNAWRTQDEAPDGRPTLYYQHPFWLDETERLTYEAAVEESPIRRDEAGFAYVRRIASTVEGRYLAAGHPMPRPLSRRERDAQLARLREQERMESARLPYAEVIE